MNSITLSEERNEETCYGYCDDYQPHAVKRMFDYKNGMLYDMRWDEAGNLGQVSIANRDAMFEAGRFLFWTEDNRMHAAVDDKYYSYYSYDHAGERRLKLTGTNDLLDVNADFMHTVSVLNNPTLYPSAYMVLTNKGYTKHYYAGTERVAARLGGGGLDALHHVIGSDEELQAKADTLFTQSQDQVNSRVLKENDLDCIMGNKFAKEVFGQRIDGAPCQMKADVEFDHGQFKDMVNSMLVDLNNGQEQDVYFYHSDHLGSASWITDANGEAVQHLQYLPYGEPYINQRTTGYNERFTFTGKERDEETGYGYFGARYMDHELMTMWLSVDPLADKYPSISPYAYCAWNPIKLVDPDGREITLWIEDGSGNTYEYKPNMTPTGDAAAQQQIQTLNEMYSSSLGQEMLDALIGSTNDYYITNESTGVPGTSATVQYGNGSRSQMGGANDMLNMSHELFHAFQYENGEGGATYKNEVEALIYSNALTLQTKGTALKQLASLNPGTSDGNNFENAMNGLLWGKTFSQTDFSTAVDLFQSQSIMNSSGIYNAKYYNKGDPSNGSLLQRFYPLMR